MKVCENNNIFVLVVQNVAKIITTARKNGLKRLNRFMEINMIIPILVILTVIQKLSSRVNNTATSSNFPTTTYHQKWDVPGVFCAHNANYGKHMGNYAIIAIR